MARECGNCRFFDGADCSEGFGECHRYAPRVHIATAIDDPMMPSATWPTVMVDDWCGEFEEKRN